MYSRYVFSLFHIEGLKHLKDLVVHSACDTNSSVGDGLACAHSLGSAFMRFSPELKYDVKLDCIDPKVLLELLIDTELAVRRNRDKFEALCILLADS